MAIVQTTTVTVNAAFLQEIKEVNQELWQQLDASRRACRRPELLVRRQRGFVERLAGLRDQLAMHFALEEAYGYFDEPLHVAPRLSETADSLRSEHADLYTQLNELAEQAEASWRNGRLPARLASLCEGFELFFVSLQRHESAENELILQAYDDDLGVGD